MLTFATRSALDEDVLHVAEAKFGILEVVLDNLDVLPDVALLRQPLVELLQDGDVVLARYHNHRSVSSSPLVQSRVTNTLYIRNSIKY